MDALSEEQNFEKSPFRLVDKNSADLFEPNTTPFHLDWNKSIIRNQTFICSYYGRSEI